MGSYTTNYKLYKVDPTVGGADEYVDVTGQVDFNLSKLDTIAKNTFSYQTYGNVTADQLPVTDNYPGYKLYSDYDASIKVWDGTQWVTTRTSANTWTDVTLAGVFATKPPTTGNPANNPGYYRDYNNNTVHLRGEFVKGANEAFTQGTVYTLAAAGSFPSPPTVRTFFVCGGSGTSRHANFYIINLLTSGQMNVSLYADNAQTAGAAENYVSMEGLTYGLS